MPTPHTLSTLPPELLHSIIQILHSNNLHCSLTSLALTSHAYLDLCAPTLYSTPRVNLSHATSSALRRILASPRAAHISGLHLSWQSTHDPSSETWLDRALFARLRLHTFTLSYNDHRPSDYWFYELQNALSACYPEHNEPCLFPHLTRLKLEHIELNKELISFLRAEVRAATLSELELDRCYCLVAGDGFCKYTWSQAFSDLSEYILTRAARLRVVRVSPRHVPWGDAYEDSTADVQAEAVKALLAEGRPAGRRMYEYRQRYFRSQRYFGGQSYTEADVAENRRQCLDGADWGAWRELETTLALGQGGAGAMRGGEGEGDEEGNMKLLLEAGVLMEKVSVQDESADVL